MQLHKLAQSRVVQGGIVVQNPFQSIGYLCNCHLDSEGNTIYSKVSIRLGIGIEVGDVCFADNSMLGYDSYYPTSSKAGFTECVTPHRGKYPDKYIHTYVYLKHILTSYFTLVKVYLAFYLTSIFPHYF